VLQEITQLKENMLWTTMNILNFFLKGVEILQNNACGNFEDFIPNLWGCCLQYESILANIDAIEHQTSEVQIIYLYCHMKAGFIQLYHHL
ncbi:hypothetical protein ACJX0J_022147, partial [Zea mays]